MKVTVVVLMYLWVVRTSSSRVSRKILIPAASYTGWRFLRKIWVNQYR